MISDNVGALPLLGCVFNHGWFMAWLIAVLFSWGMMNLLAIVLERRILIPYQQYQSFYKGDLVGLPVIVAAIEPMLHVMPAGPSHWYTSLWWHVGVLIVGLAIGVGFKWSEYKGGAYTKEQLLSPLSIYHNAVVFPVFIYWIVGCGFPALIYSRVGIRAVFSGGSTPTILLLVLLAALVYWAKLVWADVVMSDELRAEKVAHVSVSARTTVVQLPVAFTFGMAFMYFGFVDRSSLFLAWLFLGGLVFYTVTVLFDSTPGKPRHRPWAHVPFRWSYAAPWRDKPWPFITAGLPPPFWERKQAAAAA